MDFYNLLSMYLGSKPSQNELGLQNISHRVLGSSWDYVLQDTQKRIFL